MEDWFSDQIWYSRTSSTCVWEQLALQEETSWCHQVREQKVRAIHSEQEGRSGRLQEKNEPGNQIIYGTKKSNKKI